MAAVDMGRGVAKFWVYWTQAGSQSIRASYNVTRVDDTGSSGITNIIIDRDMASANYVTGAMSGSLNGGTLRQNGDSNRTTGYLSVTSEDSSGTDTDVGHLSVIAMEN